MTWERIINKLTSRKFWVAAAGVIVGIVVAFGGDAGEISEIAGTVATVVMGVTYILGEALVDSARAKADADVVVVEGIKEGEE